MEKNITIKLSQLLAMVLLGLEREDPEMLEGLSEMIGYTITDIDIYDFCRFHKADGKFDDQQFENTKSMLLEFRGTYQYGNDQFDLGSVYKHRPSIDDIFY